MVQQSRTFLMVVDTTPKEILPENPDRASYNITNQDAAIAIYVCSGRSHGPHVAVAGNHEGDRIGPNGGALFDNDDKDSVWAVAAATNVHIKILETVKSFHTVKDVMKR